MRTRNIKKQFWLNQMEVKELERKCRATNLNEAEVLRALIMDTVLKEKPDDRFYEAMVALRGIGINLNQIARIANTTGNINKKYYEAEAKKWNEFMINMKKNYLNSCNK